MISCHEFDYIEIACMHHYPLKLVLHSGIEVKGIAWDTKLNNNKQECLLLKADGQINNVILGNVKSITALVNNPNFTTVIFT